MKCKMCGREFEPARNHPHQKYCSVKCKGIGYYAENREKKIAYQREYNAKNRERVYASQKRYRVFGRQRP